MRVKIIFRCHVPTGFLASTRGLAYIAFDLIERLDHFM